MAISIPATLVEFILFGPLDDRRQLQDSPILGDVWIRYAATPWEPVDLLIAPYKGSSSGKVAREINRSFRDDKQDRQVAYLQGFVAARLTFSELLGVVVPRTKWWNKNQDVSTKQAEPKVAGGAGGKLPEEGGAERPVLKSVTQLLSITDDDLKIVIGDIYDLARKWRTHIIRQEATDRSHSGRGQAQAPLQRLQEMFPLQRFVALMGLILWAKDVAPPKRSQRDPIDFILKALTDDELGKIASLIASVKEEMVKQEFKDPDVWEVSLNRSAVPALTKSVPAVKADAARTLFSVDCSAIAWAVIDSGIHGSHPAFLDANSPQKSRVRQSFDFHNFRKIVSLSNKVPGIRAANVTTLMADKETLLHPQSNVDADAALEKIADDVEEERPIHWELVRKFVEIKPDTRPPTNHGTHVAGIIGASKKAAELHDPNALDVADGMCPDIALYDFRVLAPNAVDTEFAIIAALQFIRHLNSQDNFLKIHGANLSLSIPHDVRNYACGRTPICVECERLIESGVVVVAAAGNHGYKTFQTKDGAFDSYAAFSITDPGNADEVLTVGATHRFWPHTYGVSFFSSRGPTGDGRMKPDLVAPGERIRAPFLDGDWGDLDGTSMAAPHVSGAAAMLMARYTELISHPRRIKRILCESATSLDRERSFQGHGMLDVLRAFQSI